MAVRVMKPKDTVMGRGRQQKGLTVRTPEIRQRNDHGKSLTEQRVVMAQCWKPLQALVTAKP